MSSYFCSFIFSMSLFMCLQARAETLKIENLNQVVQIALSHSPTYKIIQNNHQIAELNLINARSNLLPSLDLTATHGLLDNNKHSSVLSGASTDNSPWVSSLSLALTESLYDNGVSLINSDIARAQQKASQLKLKDELNNFIFDTISIYLDYTLAVKKLEIQEKLQKLISKQYSQISQNYYQGISTKKDFLRIKSEFNRGQLDLLSAQSLLDKALENLKAKMNLSDEENRDIEFRDAKYEKVDINFSQDVEYENNPKVLYSTVQKDINNLNTELSNKKNRPELLLSTGVTYGSSDYLGSHSYYAQNELTEWNVTLTFKYNLFDWGGRRSLVERSLRENQNKNYSIENELIDLKQSINKLKINSKLVVKNYNLSKELLDLENGNYTYIENEYRNGKISYLDYITGLNNLLDAELRYYTSANVVEKTKYEFLFYQGKLDEVFK